ncbi:hypothetical protein JST97_35335 [bacterium]|nr:hypothetical protein [bacterium]
MQVNNFGSPIHFQGSTPATRAPGTRPAAEDLTSPALESSVVLSGAPILTAPPKSEKPSTEKAQAAPIEAPTAALSPAPVVRSPGLGPLLMEPDSTQPLIGSGSQEKSPTHTILAESVGPTVQAEAGTNFELLGLIHSFLQNPEVKQAAQDGTGGQNLGRLMDILSDQLGTGLGVNEGNVYFSGDTEGKVVNDFATLKEQGKLVAGADGKLRFRDDDTSFVFMGDLTDWGPTGLKLGEEMLSLKQSAPDRVGLVWGNRDLAKLAIHNDLPALKDMTGEAGERYSNWLSKKPPEQSANTDANRVQYWLEEHSAPQALQFHREGLEEKLGRPVDLDEAARHYVKSWSPGGTFFEFVKQGSFAPPLHLTGETHMAFHGGAARDNITAIPGEAVLPQNINDVIQGQYDLGRRLIDQCEKDLLAGRPVKSMLLSLGDSNWMASVGINAPRAESVIYSERNVEDGNLRAHEPEVAQAMLKVGKTTELVGHTPIGSVPEMRVSPEGTAKIYTDNSMAKDGSQAMVARKGPLTISVSRVGDKENGQVVFFAHQPGVDTSFGKITKDGYAVVGMTLNGDYFLSKYGAGFKLDQKVVTPQQLQLMDPQARRPEVSDTRVLVHQQVSAAIQNKMSEWGRPLLTFDTLDQVRGDRTPVLVSAASSYGRHPATQEQLLAMSQSLKDTFGNGIMVIDGGTSVKSNEGEKAPELILQETLFPANRDEAHGPKRVAAMPSVLNLDEVTLKPDAMVVEGGLEDWHLPVIKAADYVGASNGAAVFIGGGGAVAKAIEAARNQTQTPVFLVAGRGSEPMGASDRVAREANLPSHFHVIYADELHDLGPRIQSTVTRS